MKTFYNNWFAPPTELHLEAGQVHIWCIPLDRPLRTAALLANLLSKDEQERAGRFVFDSDRDHFIATRAGLRMILARYLKFPPQRLRFRYGFHGKPELTGLNAGMLSFNLSHSHGMALVAVARDCRLGVDVERVRPLEDMDAIAKRFFSRMEYLAYCALPVEQRALGFFNCWTRKEAYIKAIGEGLSYSLANFDVSLMSDEPSKLLSINGDFKAAKAWRMMSVDPGEGYVGAVVAENQTYELSCWHPDLSFFEAMAELSN